MKRIVFIIWVLVLVGCAGEIRKAGRVCEGKKTADEAIAALNAQRDKRTPIRAAGQCRLRYNLEGKKHQENFPVKVWVEPPAEIYLQGDVAFDATGLVLGANADEFWLWLKPKEISLYWWGKWSEADEWGDFAVSPEALLEAFGAVRTQGGEWSLTHGQYDILWLHSEGGELLKRVYIEPCDYVAAKIEYLNSAERVVGGVELARHRRIAEGFLVPTKIRIWTIAKDGSEDSAEIILNSVETTRINEQQKQRLFVRPSPRGFSHIYQIIEGTAVEQRHE